MNVSVITTLYRSAPHIEEFFARICSAVSAITNDFEIVFVNDGSPDDSSSIVRRLQASEVNRKIKLVELSRNFGHHHAIMVGLEHCAGDLVFLIDADLEEPPEVFGEMFQKLDASAGASRVDVVYGYQTRRKGGLSERLLGALFYKAFNALAAVEVPNNWITVRLMRRAYVTAVVAHEERELFIDGILVIAGFKQVGIPVQKASKGSTSYSLFKKVAMATHALTSFSTKPLVLILGTGMMCCFLSLLGIALILFRIFVEGVHYDAGWPSIVLAIAFFGGLILASIGVVGLYVGRVFNEVKRRPRVIKAIEANY